ncbi:hypothetical protein FRB99_002009 [Tulasnella sp. 403]|nr:hypothetical protein FRB99_002009 [Tulasnella sp. 403]
MPTMFGSIVRLTFLAPALASAFVCAFPDISIAVDGPSSVNDVRSFNVSTTITNHGDEAVTLLNSPDSVLTPEWRTNAFSVVFQRRGLAALPAGVKVKWNPQIAGLNGDVTVIPARRSITIDHHIGGVYDFSSTGEGPYEISANANFLALDGSGNVHTLRATQAKSHTAHISGKLTSVARRRALQIRAIGYNNCTDSQKSTITTAAKSAQDYIDGANQYLATLDGASPRWTTWFGPFTNTSKATVVSHFSDMNGDPESTTYDCTCTRVGVYAYVYPDQPDYIYLCDYFWQVPSTGTDSQAGTIVDMAAYWNANGGAQAYAFGQDACRDLAQSDPSEALMNADSHEYFAENNPSQN